MLSQPLGGGIIDEGKEIRLVCIRLFEVSSWFLEENVRVSWIVGVCDRCRLLSVGEPTLCGVVFTHGSGCCHPWMCEWHIFAYPLNMLGGSELVEDTMLGEKVKGAGCGICIHFGDVELTASV